MTFKRHIRKRNKAGKSTEMWEERGKWVIGIQGTGAWYVKDNYAEAKKIFRELVSSDIS